MDTYGQKEYSNCHIFFYQKRFVYLDYHVLTCKKLIVFYIIMILIASIQLGNNFDNKMDNWNLKKKKGGKERSEWPFKISIKLIVNYLMYFKKYIDTWQVCHQ